MGMIGKKEKMKRITVITGHYGSGKTEFSVNLAFDLKKTHQKVAVIDLDIANPYFRSRERQKMFQEKGIDIYFNTYGYDIAEDLPAITASLRAPLENEDYMTIVDVGGNDSGARIINQFRKYFTGEESQMLCVLNANRPETDTAEGMIMHLHAIEEETGIKMEGIINNTHLLRETTIEDVFRGYDLCKTVSARLQLPIVYNTCRRDLLEDLKKSASEKKYGNEFVIYPIDLYMRPSWLDR